MLTERRPVGVGLLGAGTVGSEVARALLERGERLAAVSGASFAVTGIPSTMVGVVEAGADPWANNSFVGSAEGAPAIGFTAFWHAAIRVPTAPSTASRSTSRRDKLLWLSHMGMILSSMLSICYARCRRVD